MFDIHKKEIVWGGRQLVFETGHVARQASGAVMMRYGDTTVLCTAVAQKSAHCQLPGKDLRRRQNSGRLLQARGAALGKGNLDLAAHRPAHPAALRRRLPRRDPGHLHRPLPRSRERSRHRRLDRRLGGADLIGDALPRSGGGGQGRLHRRRVRAQPAARRVDPQRPQSGRRGQRRRRPDGRIGGQ